jgi:hypothetical protein
LLNNQLKNLSGQATTNKTKLRGLSPQANYTDRATAAVGEVVPTFAGKAANLNAFTNYQSNTSTNKHSSRAISSEPSETQKSVVSNELVAVKHKFMLRSEETAPPVCDAFGRKMVNYRKILFVFREPLSHRRK